MRELLYLEVPTPDTTAVRDWLQQQFQPTSGVVVSTPDGIRLRGADDSSVETWGDRAVLSSELSIFTWSLQRTTYLKVFRWGDRLPAEGKLLQQLTQQIRQQFPNRYPDLPVVDLSHQSIFEALAPHYPETVRQFQRMPNGEFDLNRVYWWEKRWRENVRNPSQPKTVVFSHTESPDRPDRFYDLIYIGGALGVIHAAVMAQLGYRVLLLERLPFGRMNREWNISREEFQSLIRLGLFTAEEFEGLIGREYVNGFHKFFDANNPPQAKAPILETPTVLNIALDSEKLLSLCGEKLRAAGGDIWDETEFVRADVYANQVVVQAKPCRPGSDAHAEPLRQAAGRLLVDAMGTASPIAWQLNGGRSFDSVCPTVGAVVASGFEPGVWDAQFGDVLNSHGDVSRGRQLIWELFPGKGNDLTFYLFHYHQVHPENPGSLLEMYEDFFTILPEYRRCDVNQLEWQKPTFGYIPGHFSVTDRDRQVAVDRLVAIGDAASLQSPLVFTGFGSLVRNLARLTDLLDTALRHDLLTVQHLDQIRAYQSNVAVTWLFSKGMMVPTGSFVQPQKINAMLNTFFGVLGQEPPEVANRFIKDRASWWEFNRMAMRAASQNPALLSWIVELAGVPDMVRWLRSYFSFTLSALLSWLFQWVPSFSGWVRPWLEAKAPSLWFWLLARSYSLSYGVGRSLPVPIRVKPPVRSPLEEPAVR